MAVEFNVNVFAYFYGSASAIIELLFALALTIFHSSFFGQHMTGKELLHGSSADLAIIFLIASCLYSGEDRKEHGHVKKLPDMTELAFSVE